MKVYDSLVFPVLAVALGNTVLLSTQGVGTPAPDKPVSQTGAHITISNPMLETSGKRYTGGQSTLTLVGVVGTDSLTIGPKTYVAGTDFVVGGSDAITATNLAAAINVAQLIAQPAWVFNHENLTIEAKVSGSGAVASGIDIEHSQNGVDFSNLTTFALSGTGSAIGTFAAVRPKPFIRVKPNTLTGTSARAEVWVNGAPS
jgi:hypothetical protein